MWSGRHRTSLCGECFVLVSPMSNTHTQTHRKYRGSVTVADAEQQLRHACLSVIFIHLAMWIIWFLKSNNQWIFPNFYQIKEIFTIYSFVSDRPPLSCNLTFFIMCFFTWNTHLVFIVVLFSCPQFGGWPLCCPAWCRGPQQPSKEVSR